MGNPPTIAIIGPGVMGEAVISGLLKQGVTTAERILAAGPELDRGEQLVQRYGIQSLSDNVAAVEQADVVVLSVKPQLLNKVLEGLKGKIPGKAVVISVVAGAPIQKVSDGLAHPCVVRVMPNTPAQIGMGISVWIASPSVSPEQIELARCILKALG
ncbi:MAG: NAD(P)-binding domain-containing protein [Anaerolineaceae bacterium]|nr:NAD(P)-binding domain-containing protein [Anaerolineaceae bacterium]